MGWGMGNVGSSGASLNFSVKSYPTISELEADSPKENTIGIVTATSINGWSFSALEPAEPAEGMVWFKTGENVAVAFNALKKNNIMVYPTGCQQYISGYWVVKTAKIFQNNEWKEWRIFIFEKGDQKIDITGGWTSKEGAAMDIELDSNGMVFTLSGEGGRDGAVYTIKTIDVTPYSLLAANVEVANLANSAGQIYIGLRSTIGDSFPLESMEAYAGHQGGEALLTLNVSKLSGPFHIVVAADMCSGWADNVYLS